MKDSHGKKLYYTVFYYNNIFLIIFRAQKLFDDEEQNEIENENKENVDPDASTPSPNKKPRANPDISNVRRSLLLSPKRVLSPKSSLPRPELSSPSEVKIIKNDDLTQLISNSTPKTKRNLQFRRHEGMGTLDNFCLVFIDRR